MPGYLPGAAGRTMWVRMGPVGVEMFTCSLSMMTMVLNVSGLRRGRLRRGGGGGGRELPCGGSGGFGIALGLAMTLKLFGDVGGELEQLCANHAFESDDGGVGQGEADTALVRGVVSVGDAAGDEVAHDVGDIELPLAVVSVADEGSEGRVDDAGLDGSFAFAEVTGILMEDGWKHGVADYVSDDVIGVAGGNALEVPGRSVAVAGVVVGEFAIPAAEDRRDADGVGIDDGMKRKGPLLAGGQGYGVSVHDYAEIRNDAADALFLLGLHFTFSLLTLLAELALLLGFAGRRRGRRLLQRSGEGGGVRQVGSAVGCDEKSFRDKRANRA